MSRTTRRKAGKANRERRAREPSKVAVSPAESSPVESPTEASPAEAPPAADSPRFRSYFDLLDEKYGDGDAPPRVVSDEIPPEWATGTGQQPLVHTKRRRRDHRAALVAALALFAVGVVLTIFLTTSSEPRREAPSVEASVDVSVDAAPDVDAPAVETVGQPPAAATPTARTVEGAGMVDQPEPTPRSPSRVTTIGDGPPADGRAREVAAVDRSTAPSPGSTAPEPMTPENPAPENPAPEITAPENPAPEITAPESAAPEITAPESTAPESTAPEATAPETTTPEEAVTTVAPLAADAGEPSTAPTPATDDVEPRVEPPAPLGELVAAESVFAPQPRYPDEARRRGAQGTVVVLGTVGVDGSVRDARVLVGRDEALDRAALEAFRTWQFEPARVGGRAIDSTVRIGIHFKLDQARAVAPLPWGGDFVPPVRVEAVPPAYPREAWEAGVEGIVLLQLVVDEQGRVTAAEVLQGLPYGLSEAALEAVRGWVFRPAQRKGRPVAVEHRVSVRFAPPS